MERERLSLQQRLGVFVEMEAEQPVRTNRVVAELKFGPGQRLLLVQGDIMAEPAKTIIIGANEVSFSFFGHVVFLWL